MEYNLYQLVRHKILNTTDIKKINKVELFERGEHWVSFFGCGEEERWPSFCLLNSQLLFLLHSNLRSLSEQSRGNSGSEQNAGRRRRIVRWPFYIG